MNGNVGALRIQDADILSQLREADVLANLQDARFLSELKDQELLELLQDRHALSRLGDAGFLSRLQDAELVAHLQNPEFMAQVAALQEASFLTESIQSITPSGLLIMCLPVFVIAFLVTLLVTPLFRRMAFSLDVVDRPLDARKIHTRATPYLGGLAVASGLLVALLYSYSLSDQWPVGYRSVPFVVLFGMLAIALAGLLDDVTNVDARYKVALILIAAAALAQGDVGTRVAAQLLDGIGLDVVNSWVLPGFPGHWTLTNLIGALIIGIFVLGGCNATNLIDGLDGLLSGVTGIVAIGLLALSVILVDFITLIDVQRLQTSFGSGNVVENGVTLAAVRIVLCLAVLGSVLGFLPHNFNPARIFLGDCGSLLLGYMCVVIILMLGEAGQTHLMIAGLIIFAIPIIDTLLAIVRRHVQGKKFWDPDAKHMHHILKRRLGGVKRAVLAIYALGAFFAVLGAGLGILHLMGDVRVYVIYLVFLSLMAIVVLIGWRMGLAEKRETKS